MKCSPSSCNQENLLDKPLYDAMNYQEISLQNSDNRCQLLLTQASHCNEKKPRVKYPHHPRTRTSQRPPLVRAFRASWLIAWPLVFFHAHAFLAHATNQYRWGVTAFIATVRTRLLPSVRYLFAHYGGVWRRGRGHVATKINPFWTVPGRAL